MAMRLVGAFRACWGSICLFFGARVSNTAVVLKVFINISGRVAIRILSARSWEVGFSLLWETCVSIPEGLFPVTHTRKVVVVLYI